MALVVDAVAIGGLDRVAMIDLEGSHLHTILFVDDAVLAEFLDVHGDALRRQLLVHFADADVERVSLFKVGHQIFGAGRADDVKGSLAAAEYRTEPAGQPDIRDAGYTVSYTHLTL